MKRLRPILQKWIVLAIIPLTLFSGRPTGGCLCADGHIELFCSAELRCLFVSSQASTSPTNKAACCCPSATAPNPATGASCCHGQNVTVRRQLGEPSQMCCYRLHLSPMVLAGDLLFAWHSASTALNEAVSATFHQVVIELRTCPYSIDLGPPRARLSLLQHFLI